MVSRLNSWFDRTSILMIEPIGGDPGGGGDGGGDVSPLEFFWGDRIINIPALARAT